MSTPPLLGHVVRIQGLSGRPELNGSLGLAESFNSTTSRYLVRLHARTEIVALRPLNLVLAAGASSTEQASAAPSQRWSSRFHMPSLPGGVTPEHIAVASAAALVMLLKVSVLNAILLSGLGYMCFSAAQREGGLTGTLKRVTSGAAKVIHRATGTAVTPAQAGFLIVGVLFLIWYYWVGGMDSFGSSTRGGHSYAETGSARRDGSSRYPHRAASEEYEYADGGGGSFFGSGWDLSLVLSTGMLGMYCYNLGGGGTPDGWSLGQLIHRVRSMDLWQMMMLMNLVQQVLGGGRRRGVGGFGRRGMYF